MTIAEIKKNFNFNVYDVAKAWKAENEQLHMENAQLQAKKALLEAVRAQLEGEIAQMEAEINRLAAEKSKQQDAQKPLGDGPLSD